MQRPKLTLLQVNEIILASKQVIPEAVKVVAIRGYYLDTLGKPGENDRGLFDDAMFLIGPNYFQSFNANTDPSKYKPGIASLVPGLHYYKKGKHGLSKPNPYDAFRPDTIDESFPVTRDGHKGVTKGIAINLHKAGMFTTSSEGCQTIIADQWDEFQKTTYKMMDAEAQRRLPYLLAVNIDNKSYRFSI